MALSNRLKEVVDSLDYDFSEFELTHFVQHIVRLKRRDIILVPVPLELGLYAVWIPAETAHYIFYNVKAHAIHQTHSILHEIAHIVLDHSRKHIGQVLPQELLAQIEVSTPHGRLRQADPQLGNDSEEYEAEAFVFIIQKHLVAAKRMNELMGQSSSIEGLRRWVDSMAFTD